MILKLSLATFQPFLLLENLVLNIKVWFDLSQLYWTRQYESTRVMTFAGVFCEHLQYYIPVPVAGIAPKIAAEQSLRAGVTQYL